MYGMIKYFILKIGCNRLVQTATEADGWWLYNIGRSSFSFVVNVRLFPVLACFQKSNPKTLVQTTYEGVGRSVTFMHARLAKVFLLVLEKIHCPHLQFLLCSLESI